MSDALDILHQTSSGENGAVPLTAYQEFVLYRFKMEETYDINSNPDRFRFLMWYLAGYTQQRRPLRVPLSAAQIRWLLEPSDINLSERSMPRIVDAYWRKHLAGSLNPYLNDDQYLHLVYWWCVEMAPSISVEHALVPDNFISMFSRPAVGFEGKPVHASEFLVRHARKSDGEFSVRNASLRFASYLKILMGEKGHYLSLFFSPQVLQFLDNLANAAPSELRRIDTGMAGLSEALWERINFAREYREAHKRIRLGKKNVDAATLEGGDWETGEALGKVERPALRLRSPKAHIEQAIGETPDFLRDYEVAIIGPLRSQSGLSQAARMSIEAFRAVGVEPALVDFHLDHPAPRVLTPENRVPDPTKKRINLFHLNAETLPIATAYLSDNHWKDALNIAYFFWELPTPAPCHHLALRLVDEVWVSSEYNRQTYAEKYDTPVVCQGIAVEPLSGVENFDREETRRQFGIPADAFALITTFDSYSFLTRKNPAGAVRAFQAAFGPDENVCLVLKTQNMSKVLSESSATRRIAELRDLVDGDNRIVLLDETLAFSEVIRLKAALDGYLSLHRAEGWGYGLIESMQLAKPVIATDFSGNLEFCNKDTSLLVPWTKRRLKPNDYIFSTPEDFWAEPDIQEAAKLIRKLRDDVGLRHRLGKAGAELVAERFSPKAVGQRYINRLQERVGVAAASPSKNDT